MLCFFHDLVSVLDQMCGDAGNGDIRLVGGSNEFEGRVEICLDGEWGTICDNFWSAPDATVVCRQLGLGTTDAVSLVGAHFGPGNGSIHFDRLICSGDEERLTDCLHFQPNPESCLHEDDASVRCSSEEMSVCICPHMFMWFLYPLQPYFVRKERFDWWMV